MTPPEWIVRRGRTEGADEHAAHLAALEAEAGVLADRRRALALAEAALEQLGHGRIADELRPHVCAERRAVDELAAELDRRRGLEWWQLAEQRAASAPAAQQAGRAGPSIASAAVWGPPLAYELARHARWEAERAEAAARAAADEALRAEREREWAAQAVRAARLEAAAEAARPWAFVVVAGDVRRATAWPLDIPPPDAAERRELRAIGRFEGLNVWTSSRLNAYQREAWHRARGPVAAAAVWLDFDAEAGVGELDELRALDGSAIVGPVEVLAWDRRRAIPDGPPTAQAWSGRWPS